MAATATLTGALEDYLETVYELVRDHKVARVRDIASARGVRAASVSPAMRRLADLGLIRYLQREFIELTPQGQEEARRVYAKHQMLTQLFVDVLGMAPEEGKRDACAMEHSLSSKGMDHLVRFLEFLRVCPGGKTLLDTFRKCSLVQQDAPVCGMNCNGRTRQDSRKKREAGQTIAELAPGSRARVTQVQGSGAIRQRLLDMGLLPGAVVEIERVAPSGDPIWIKLQGFQLSLRGNEAKTVHVAGF